MESLEFFNEFMLGILLSLLAVLVVLAIRLVIYFSKITLLINTKVTDISNDITSTNEMITDILNKANLILDELPSTVRNVNLVIDNANKFIEELPNSLGSITQDVSKVENNIDIVLSSSNNMINSLNEKLSLFSFSKLNQILDSIIRPIKSVASTVAIPATKVQKFLSATSKFFSVFKEKLYENR